MKTMSAQLEEKYLLWKLQKLFWLSTLPVLVLLLIFTNKGRGEEHPPTVLKQEQQKTEKMVSEHSCEDRLQDMKKENGILFYDVKGIVAEKKELQTELDKCIQTPAIQPGKSAAYAKRISDAEKALNATLSSLEQQLSSVER